MPLSSGTHTLPSSTSCASEPTEDTMSFLTMCRREGWWPGSVCSRNASSASNPFQMAFPAAMSPLGRIGSRTRRARRSSSGASLSSLSRWLHTSARAPASRPSPEMIDRMSLLTALSPYRSTSPFSTSTQSWGVTVEASFCQALAPVPVETMRPLHLYLSHFFPPSLLTFSTDARHGSLSPTKTSFSAHCLNTLPRFASDPMLLSDS
mmetsp:Transcript_12298/g.24329  ORF Transcript_12298/g.24329 Transcript_12298/m.24329 type:complete len:207 (+) Transcript_12298:211-831(+)